MVTISLKADFLRSDFADKLNTLDPATKGLWGKMNMHQMIEHMSYAFREANGKEVHACITPEEHLPRMQAFIKSDKPFRENTPNQLLPDIPAPPKHNTVDASIAELKVEIVDFFTLYQNHPDKTLTNPFFGELNYEMWIQLLHKHALHHLRQFGVNV